MNETKDITIDASGKTLGRLAGEVSVLLRGKDRPDYAPHKESGVSVRVENASRLSIPRKKEEGKIYFRHSGYPGGLKKETLGTLAGRRGYGEVIRRAVYGMLPANKLRARMMKRLSITE